jgi:hypothetical protein
MQIFWKPLAALIFALIPNSEVLLVAACLSPHGVLSRFNRYAVNGEVLQVSRADRKGQRDSQFAISGGEFKESVDESILPSDILRGHSSDLTFS